MGSPSNRARSLFYPGASTTTCLALDSVDPTAGPLAPRLSLKDANVGCAESRPAPALHSQCVRSTMSATTCSCFAPPSMCRVHTTCPKRHAREEAVPTLFAVRPRPSRNTCPRRGRCSQSRSDHDHLGTHARAKARCSQSRSDYGHPGHMSRRPCPRGDDAPRGLAWGRLSAEPTLASFSESLGARGPAGGATESSARAIVVEAPKQNSERDLSECRTARRTPGYARLRGRFSRPHAGPRDVIRTAKCQRSHTAKPARPMSPARPHQPRVTSTIKRLT